MQEGAGLGGCEEGWGGGWGGGEIGVGIGVRWRRHYGGESSVWIGLARDLWGRML